MTTKPENIDTSAGHVHTRDRSRADVIRIMQDVWDRAIEIDDAADELIDLLDEIERQEPVFMWHRGATAEESEVVDVDCACPCCVPLYAHPQPVPDVSALVEALEQVIKSAPSGGPLWHGSEQIVEARAALAAYRKED